MKIDWRSKLASRKFWALLATLAVSVALGLGAGQIAAERIVAVITAAGAVAVYILAEASVDRAQAKRKRIEQ